MTRKERRKAFHRFLRFHGIEKHPWFHVYRVETSLLDDLETRGALADPSKVVVVKARGMR